MLATSLRYCQYQIGDRLFSLKKSLTFWNYCHHTVTNLTLSQAWLMPNRTYKNSEKFWRPFLSHGLLIWNLVGWYSNRSRLHINQINYKYKDEKKENNKNCKNRDNHNEIKMRHKFSVQTRLKSPYYGPYTKYRCHLWRPLHIENSVWVSQFSSKIGVVIPTHKWCNSQVWLLLHCPY